MMVSIFQLFHVFGFQTLAAAPLGSGSFSPDNA